MSDYTNAFDEDPTNAFLARESAILGDAAQQFTTPSLTSQGSPTLTASSFPLADALGDFSSPENAISNTSFGEGSFGAQDLSFNSVGSMPTPETPVNAVNSPLPSLVPEIEPEAIREHRNKQAQLIAERDARSERKRQENIEAARRAIDSFYENYNTKKEKAIKENRESQEALLASLNDTVTGTFWERVLKHIDVGSGESSGRSGSVSGSGAPKKGSGTKDVSRMKSILQSLRGDPKAPGCVPTGSISA